jgi:hypothetical protein
MEYLKIWTSFRESISPLNDAEKGRLFDAMLLYAETGEQPDFKGNERYIWPTAKQAIDRAAQKADTLRQNGSKGGRPPKPEETKENQTKANESYLFDKDKENIKEKEIDSNNHSSARANPFTVSDEELAEALERDRKIEDASRAWGLPCNEGNMIKARDMARVYSLEWLLRAIETAGSGKEQTWRYVGGILKSWKENGGPDAPRKQRARPAKVVSAQQYQQRNYTESELDSVTAEMIAEAKRMVDTA